MSFTITTFTLQLGLRTVLKLQSPVRLRRMSPTLLGIFVVAAGFGLRETTQPKGFVLSPPEADRRVAATLGH